MNDKPAVYNTLTFDEVTGELIHVKDKRVFTKEEITADIKLLRKLYDQRELRFKGEIEEIREKNISEVKILEQKIKEQEVLLEACKAENEKLQGDKFVDKVEINHLKEELDILRKENGENMIAYAEEMLKKDKEIERLTNEREEEVDRINNYGRHQFNRGSLKLDLVSFDKWRLKELESGKQK